MKYTFVTYTFVFKVRGCKIQPFRTTWLSRLLSRDLITVKIVSPNLQTAMNELDKTMYLNYGNEEPEIRTLFEEIHLISVTSN